MRIHQKIVGLVLAAALLLSGCAFSRNDLISSWKVSSNGLIMTFTPEGVLHLVPPPPAAGAALNDSARISYRFIDDSSITISPAAALGLTENQPIAFTIKGDTLTLDFGGQPVTLTRVP